MTGAPPPTPRMVIEQIDGIIRSVRESSDEVNRRWGFNRLPHLVSFELLERFKVQKAAWEIACFETCASAKPADLKRMQEVGGAMKRAYTALEAEALHLGKEPAPPGVWGFELKNGTPITLVRSRSEMGNVERVPGGQVWCLEEIGEIISRYPELVLAKDVFPEAEVIKISPSNEVRELIDDCLEEIPFAG